MKFILKMAAAVLPGILLGTTIPDGYVLIPANSEFEFAQEKNFHQGKPDDRLPVRRERSARNMREGQGQRGMTQMGRQQRGQARLSGARNRDGGRSDSSRKAPMDRIILENMMRKGEAAPLKEDYYLCKYPVTNKEYQAFIDATGRQTPAYWTEGKFPEGKGEHPVVMVSYEDAAAYCDWLTSENPGWSFRIPSEAEWENAAAGTQKFLYPWGNEANITVKDGVVESPFNFNAVVAAEYLQSEPERFVEFSAAKLSHKGKRQQIKALLSINDNGMVKGWSDPRSHAGFEDTDLFAEISGNGGCTQSVKTYSQNVSPYGCCDMVGNVWEWTSSTAVTDKTDNDNYVVRGGSWRSELNTCNAKYRGEWRKPDSGYDDLGFRVVAEKINTASEAAEEE